MASKARPSLWKVQRFGGCHRNAGAAGRHRDRDQAAQLGLVWKIFL